MCTISCLVTWGEEVQRSPIRCLHLHNSTTASPRPATCTCCMFVLQQTYSVYVQCTCPMLLYRPQSSHSTIIWISSTLTNHPCATQKYASLRHTMYTRPQQTSCSKSMHSTNTVHAKLAKIPNQIRLLMCGDNTIKAGAGMV